MASQNLSLDAQLRILMIGLADQAIKSGNHFFYDGGRLLAEDVANITTTSVLCLAQDLSERVGTGDFGMGFSFGSPNPIFPMELSQTNIEVDFFRIAPFVAEIFDGEVMECRLDLTRLYVSAARVLNPDFALPTQPAPQQMPVAVQDYDKVVTSHTSLER